MTDEEFRNSAERFAADIAVVRKEYGIDLSALGEKRKRAAFNEVVELLIKHREFLFERDRRARNGTN